MTSAERHELVLAPVYERGDRLMLGLLALHLLFAIWFAVFYDTWLETLAVGSLAVAIFALSMFLQPGTLLTRCVAGISLQAFVALHIYQLHGLAEMHFFFFTAFAAMIAYQDWRCMWPGAALIIAQHVLFAVLHNQGVNVYFYEGDYVGLTKLGFHFGIALFHVGLCNVWASLLRRQTLIDDEHRALLAAAQATAERASATKTEFLGNMSHELRTPMAGVLGMTELVLQQELTPEQRESLEVVRNSARALVDIVNDALDLTRVEAGRLELASAPINMRRVAEEVAELLQPHADKDGVELVVRWAPGSPSMLSGDEGRLRQILLNLGGNAIKFAESGFVLLELSATAGPIGAMSTLKVQVHDNGRGIPEDVQAKLFTRFEQGGSSTFSRHGGSGLGLAICKELVALMHGRLSMHSVPGAGTTFVFEVSLPIAAVAVLPPQVQARVLLVGRREVTLGVLAEQLEAMGASVTAVNNAAQAVQVFATRKGRGVPFDLLLTDPELMPNLDQLCNELRIVMLGVGNDEAPGERIVWINRHEELLRIVAGVHRTPKTDDALPRLGLRVLVAEDDAVCARVATKMLEVLGCTVVLAENGAVAVTHYQEDSFDVVLMDCRMPVMDGYQAIAAIRALPTREHRVTILSLSANSLPADREACFRAGADEFLTKPVTMQQLAHALQTHTGEFVAATAGA